MKTKTAFRMSAMALAFATPMAFATNGYFTHGVGSHNKAQAGAGIASPSQAIDAANNPASALLIDDQSNAGLSVFSPRRTHSASTSMAQGNGGAFSITSQGEQESGSNYFPIPYYATKWTLSDDSALAFSFYGRGGMNTDWSGGSVNFDMNGDNMADGPFPGTYGAGDAGVDLMQAYIELAYAKRLTDSVVVGIAPVAVIQAFEATGLNNFAPYTKTFVQTFMATGDQMAAFGSVDSLTGNGHEYSTGLGIKLGVNFELSDSVSLALAYQPKISMSEFDDYASLFAEGGSFDIPASARVGLSIQASPNLTVHIDGEQIDYSGVASVSNSGLNLYQCPTAGMGGMNVEACLGGNQGAGFGWDDMSVVKLGATWTTDSMPGTTFRAGFSTGSGPISDKEVLFNILAPGVMEQHFTFGFARDMGEGSEWGMTVMYAPEETVSGTSMFDPTQTVNISMKQYDIEFFYTW